jgi:hypothetical protein
MTTGSDSILAWCARAWRCVQLAVQVMVAWDEDGQFIGCGPPGPVVPTTWAYYARSADGPRAPLAETVQHPVTGRARAFTPVEQARLRSLRKRYQVDRTRFTRRELAHLHFVRWLHQAGRLTG